MRVTLFVPCFVDTLFPRAAIDAVTVLERLGHTVGYAQNALCCGQPAYNTGYWPEARVVARRTLKALRRAEAVVVVSGSCGAMLRNFYPTLFAGTPQSKAANELAAKTWEFSEFVVDKLGVTDVGARFAARVTFHDGCHGLRELGVRAQPRALLAKVAGLEVVEMDEAQTCCGFGGAFAVKFAEISTSMGDVKCDSAVATGAEYIVSLDSSCLMQIQGLLDRRGSKLRSLHLAEVLAKTEEL